MRVERVVSGWKGLGGASRRGISNMSRPDVSNNASVDRAGLIDHAGGVFSLVEGDALDCSISALVPAIAR